MTDIAEPIEGDDCPDCGETMERYHNGNLEPWDTCHDCALSVLPTGEVVRNLEKDESL